MISTPTEKTWQILEALRVKGFHVIIRTKPDQDICAECPDRYMVMLQGFEPFVGDTLDEAVGEMARSRCWMGPRREPRRVRIAEILGDVQQAASERTAPFRADELADELGIFGSAAAQALKKLNWPRSNHKTRIPHPHNDEEEIEVYVYNPKIG